MLDTLEVRFHVIFPLDFWDSLLGSPFEPLDSELARCCGQSEGGGGLSDRGPIRALGIY